MPTFSKESINKRITGIAWPMMLSSASVPLLGMVDTALLGHLDSEQFLAAVALGSMFIGLMYWSFGFLRMGTTGQSARAVGAALRDPVDEASASSRHAVLFRASTLAIALGGCVLLSVPLFIETVLSWLQASAELRPLAEEYIDIRRYSAPAVFMTMAISGYLIGCQHPRAALAIVLTTNLANIGLDIWFIAGLGWQSAGAAWATLIAEYLGLALALTLAARYSQLFSWQHWRGWLDLGELVDMLRYNAHLLVRTVLLMLVFNFFTAEGAAAGDTVLAANSILLQLVLFAAFAQDGFSFAAEALCGEAHGSRDRARLSATIQLCRNWMLGAGLLFAVVYALLGQPILGIFSDLPQVLAMAEQYLFWVVLIAASGYLAYLMDGVHIGLGHTAAMHYSMWLSVLAFGLGWYAGQPLGNHGLWLAFTLFVLCRGLLLRLHLGRLLSKL